MGRNEKSTCLYARRPVTATLAAAFTQNPKSERVSERYREKEREIYKRRHLINQINRHYPWHHLSALGINAITFGIARSRDCQGTNGGG